MKKKEQRECRPCLSKTISEMSPFEIDTDMALQSIREVFEAEAKSKQIVHQMRLNTPLRPLITDNFVNKLYLSALLKDGHAGFIRRFERILQEQQIEFQYLENTLDIWCRDYMPVQLDRDNLMQFRYDPCYLKYKKYRATKTIGTEALPEEVGFADECDIVLDGGNVVSCGEKVIVSEVIFRDNPGRDHGALIKELEGLFRHPVIVIPRIPGDFTGHADGMVRYYKKGVVLINNYSELVSVNSKRIAGRLLSILREAGLTTVTVPYYPNENTNYTSAYGCYINFLRFGETVFLPSFASKKQDAYVLAFFKELFPSVVPVPSREIAAKGGLLNCITWTVKK